MYVCMYIRNSMCLETISIQMNEWIRNIYNKVEETPKGKFLAVGTRSYVRTVCACVFYIYRYFALTCYAKTTRCSPCQRSHVACESNYTFTRLHMHVEEWKNVRFMLTTKPAFMPNTFLRHCDSSVSTFLSLWNKKCDDGSWKFSKCATFLAIVFE